MVALEILTERSIIKCQDAIDQNLKDTKLGKQEALTVLRLVTEILVKQLDIPARQIVNDTSFSEYTGIKRPDLLISEIEYDKEHKNDVQFIENLVAYAEVKDDSIIGDSNWNEAFEHGLTKAPKLKLPYFIVTNGNTCVYYNLKTKNEIKLGGNPLREFQGFDILRLIKNHLKKNPKHDNIPIDVGSRSNISETIFNRKLWELAKVYRGIKFENNVQKIDFTIGFIALEFFEEKSQLNNSIDSTKTYWSDCSNGTKKKPCK